MCFPEHLLPLISEITERFQEGLSDSETTVEASNARERWRRAARLSLEAARQVEAEGERLLQDINSGQDLSQWEPDLCIQMLRIPAAQNYVAISKLLRRASNTQNPYPWGGLKTPSLTLAQLPGPGPGPDHLLALHL
ncbi:hypothetical protein J6590_025441 [Homalodisca vitripennis]|nr:hypothetical protein J6590_025441 [Homalodisca vitripennis]